MTPADLTITEQAEWLATQPTDPGLAAQALATLALAAQVGRIADALEAYVAGDHAARTVDLAPPTPYAMERCRGCGHWYDMHRPADSERVAGCADGFACSCTGWRGAA